VPTRDTHGFSGRTYPQVAKPHMSVRRCHRWPMPAVGYGGCCHRCCQLRLSSGRQGSAWMPPRAIAQWTPCDKDWHVGWKLPALAIVLWVIALTVVGVAVGQVIGGPEGAVIGAIPGALAA